MTRSSSWGLVGYSVRQKITVRPQKSTLLWLEIVHVIGRFTNHPKMTWWKVFFWSLTGSPNNTSSQEACPEDIVALASLKSRVSVQNITVADGIEQRLELPIGVYRHHILRDNLNCSQNIVIKGNEFHSTFSLGKSRGPSAKIFKLFWNKCFN